MAFEERTVTMRVAVCDVCHRDAFAVGGMYYTFGDSVVFCSECHTREVYEPELARRRAAVPPPAKSRAKARG